MTQSAIAYQKFPTHAGVYFFKDANNAILYIGKAKNLKNRITSYFFSSDFKVVELLKVAVDVEVVTTNNEIEALFLEAQLIRQHQPPFNRLLKAGNPYIYIWFADMDEQSVDKKIPTLSIVRYKKKKGHYFGPFLTKRDAQLVVEYLKKSLQLTICNKKIDSGCLQYHINICAGSCKSDFDLHAYLYRLNIARQILDNKYDDAIQLLDEQIVASNAVFNFERSAHLVTYRQHLIAIVHVLQALHSTKLTNIATFAAHSVQEQNRVNDSNIQLLSNLKKRLNLPKIPYTIDCFDISHMQSQSMVGSCVRFLNGKPDKKNFRHFAIKSLVVQDDCAALVEIVTRRYKKVENYPDLIIIDGGKGQLHATQHLAGPAQIISIAKGDNRKVGAETIFIADRKHVVKGLPLPLASFAVDIHNPADRLLLEIRDYAHHFAISFHRKKQKLTDK